MSHLSLRGREAPEAISEQRNEIASLRYALGRLPQKARLAMTGKVAQCGSLLKCDIVEVVTLQVYYVFLSGQQLHPFDLLADL